MLRLLDLFSGIGGFSLGMEATKRIKTMYKNKNTLTKPPKNYKKDLFIRSDYNYSPTQSTACYNYKKG